VDIDATEQRDAGEREREMGSTMLLGATTKERLNAVAVGSHLVLDRNAQTPKRPWPVLCTPHPT